MLRPATERAIGLLGETPKNGYVALSRGARERLHALDLPLAANHVPTTPRSRSEIRLLLRRISVAPQGLCISYTLSVAPQGLCISYTQRRRKRNELLQATEESLQKITREVARRTKTPLSAAEIGKKVGRVLNHFKVGKHFTTMIEDGRFSYARREETIQREAELDGIYVIRTSEPLERLNAEDTVRSYKKLSRVEQAFRCLKTVDLLVRPIRHRDELRVKAHIFLCMLAYYLEWHLRKALAPLLFDDEELDVERKRRDPVLPAKPSASAQRKKHERQTDDGLPIHSFETLLVELGTRCRHRCRLKSDATAPAFEQHTERNALQQRAVELVAAFPVTAISSR